ncbi:MAG: hypothetical protein GYA51_01270 [Candidatus Methanofastidiosa archaeon]|jgi:hypothetical protein|nr:hypothetical protein [Candidatus Methanofastidiosa archaeon]
MNQIKINSVHLASSQNLTEIQENEWEIIAQQKHSFFLSDTNDIHYLRFPGFVFSNLEAQNNYLKIYKDFVDNNIYTPSRGNLSKSNNYIFIGIRPGHVYAHLSKADTAWLFGPSSTLLHKLLIATNIYPYFTNIYNEPNKPFNKDFNFIFKELVVIFYIYKIVYQINEMNLVFMGNYEEYPLFKEYLLNHPIIKKFNMKINFRSIWHPGFLARGYDDRKFETWKSQLR